jgi:hypothetical protein
MWSLLKMIGVSAVLSGTLVTGYNAVALDYAASKPFQQRLTEEDPALAQAETPRVPSKASAPQGLSKACEGQAWPYYDQSCLKSHRADLPSSPVRSITIETRTAPATSALTRVPQAVMAQR